MLFSATRLDIGGCVFGDIESEVDTAGLGAFVKKAMSDKTEIIFWLGEVRSVFSFDEGGDLRIKTTPEVLKVLSALT
jgi:hypothetical protein